MKHILKKVIAIAIVVTMLAAVPAMDAQAAVVKYATYTNTRFTYTVKYPTTFQRADYGSGDGTKLFSKDGKAKATIWNSYGKTGKRSGKTVVATAKKNRKINVKRRQRQNAVIVIKWEKIPFSTAMYSSKTVRSLSSLPIRLRPRNTIRQRQKV